MSRPLCASILRFFMRKLGCMVSPMCLSLTKKLRKKGLEIRDYVIFMETISIHMDPLSKIVTQISWRAIKNF